MKLEFVINPLSELWWIGIIISISIGVFIIQLAIRIPPDKRTLLRLSIAFLMFFEEIFNQWYMFYLGIWDLSTSLPIHLCGITGILAGFMMIKNRQIGFEFIVMPGLAGAAHALLTPLLNHGGDIYQVINYYVGHSGIIIVALYLAIVEGYRIRKKSWMSVFFIIQILIVVIGVANWVFSANYMYLSKAPTVSNPLIIGGWPWYIIFFEILGFLHISVLYFCFRKMKPLPF
tara:strand:- start:99 stop:791 length:693 start_codon:yes stop_codon:yes gene_type:complete